MNYRTGNVIIFVLQRIVAARTTPLRVIGTEPSSTYILRNLRYNLATCISEHLRSEDGLAHIIQLQNRIPSVRVILTVQDFLRLTLCAERELTMLFSMRYKTSC